MASRKTQTADDVDRFRLALVPVDEAFWNSEQRWGVGRLERLLSPATLAAYQRGWQRYRAALEEGDPDQLEAIAPLMIKALNIMSAEAEAAGHRPLAPDTWEADMGNGVVLCVVRTQADASAVIRTNLGDTTSAETTIPPDLAVTIRQQHEGRALCVITLAEIVRLLQNQETGLYGTKWEGTPAPSGRQQHEMAAYDTVRSGYPLRYPVDVPTTSAAVLPF